MFAYSISSFGFEYCSYEFLRTSATELHDGGRHLMMKQRGFQLINPTEKWFPGLMEIRNSLSSWEWCYGKTPKFSIQKELQLKSDEKDHDVQLNVCVNSVSIFHFLNSMYWFEYPFTLFFLTFKGFNRRHFLGNTEF